MGAVVQINLIVASLEHSREFSQRLGFSVEDLETAVADLRIAGAGIVKPPTDMPWGQRFAIVTDPDGHRVGLKASSSPV